MATWGEACGPVHIDPVIIGMASIPERSKGMIRVIQQFLPYCTHFDVYLNRYSESFHHPIFDDPRVNAFRGADIGPHGKFYMAHRTRGYFLTVDDDLIYPDDYVFNTVASIEKYKRQAVVGYHGTTFTTNPDPLQPQTRMLFSHAAYLEHDLPVHMLGTGLFAYHTDTVYIDWRDMVPGKIDEQVAILLQNGRIPQLCLAHPEDWVTEDEELRFRCALRRNKEASAAAVQRQQRRWDLYLPDSWKEYQRFP